MTRPKIHFEKKTLAFSGRSLKLFPMDLKPRIIILVCVIFVTCFFMGCQTKHEIDVKPIEVKPMEVTLNINLNIKMVNEELNTLFGETEEDQKR